MSDLAIHAPVPGVVASLPVAVGEEVSAGRTVAVLEVMKMEHPVVSAVAGVLTALHVVAGDAVSAGDQLASVRPGAISASAVHVEEGAALDHVRPDLAELLERRSYLADSARPDRVEQRHARGHRTIRENVADLCDEGSFEEWGGLVLAAQLSRRPLEELIQRTPADGLVAGIATVNSDRCGAELARCAIAGYDYLVLAGTQGMRNHRKKDRLFQIVERLRLPLVLFAEGGGGRPGDTDAPVIAGLDTMAFALFARLSGLVPTVGIATGYCFAGNAALLGCCDVIIATADSSIGMGGPAMIEGGGLGVHRPQDVGPVSVQSPNGVIDLVAADDTEAVALAKSYLSYFQGSLADWECADQRGLRSLVPESRTRVYDIREVVSTLCDTGSVLELRPQFGVGIVTALARIEGRPVGIIANNPAHLGGAIDADAADKAARHVGLCDAHGLPVVALCDTPGFMVGPEAEESAQVRRFARMFVTAASIDVPYVTVVLRKGYGLGAQAMAGGSFHASLLTVSWPSGEFGGMGLEGAVRLAYRRELGALEEPAARQALYDKLVAAAYERGRALSMATHFEIDDVIDPAETRRRIVHVLASVPRAVDRTGKRRPLVDPY